jgi:hypothetical protein
MTQDEAKLQYIAVIDELAATHGAAGQEEGEDAVAAGSEDLLVEISYGLVAGAFASQELC